MTQNPLYKAKLERAEQQSGKFAGSSLAYFYMIVGSAIVRLLAEMRKGQQANFIRVRVLCMMIVWLSSLREGSWCPMREVPRYEQNVLTQLKGQVTRLTKRRGNELIPVKRRRVHSPFKTHERYPGNLHGELHLAPSWRVHVSNHT